MCNPTDGKDFHRKQATLISCIERETKLKKNLMTSPALSTTTKEIEKKKNKNKNKKEDTFIVGLLNWHVTAMGIGAGLANLGNTCYLNSVLQCLTYTPALAQYLLTTPITTNNNYNNEFNMLKVMKKHVQTTLIEKNHHQKNQKNRSSSAAVVVVAPHAIVKNLKRIAKHFQKYRQEDSHEFLRHVLDGMQKSMLRNQNIKNEHSNDACKTVMHQIFGGKFRSRVACNNNNCSYVSDTYQPFLDISLEVSNKRIHSVNDAFNHYSMVEMLDKHNAWKCSKCQRNVQAKKSLMIECPSNVLILHLKRFHHCIGKIHKHITFHESLDITAFVTSNNTNNNYTYRLDAVLVHSGHTVHSGHYYAFVRAPNGLWFEVNDECVRHVSIELVLRQQAYILFYSRCIPKKSKKKKNILQNQDLIPQQTKKLNKNCNDSNIHDQQQLFLKKRKFNDDNVHPKTLANCMVGLKNTSSCHQKNVEKGQINNNNNHPKRTEESSSNLQHCNSTNNDHASNDHASKDNNTVEKLIFNKLATNKVDNKFDLKDKNNQQRKQQNQSMIKKDLELQNIRPKKKLKSTTKLDKQKQIEKEVVLLTSSATMSNQPAIINKQNIESIKKNNKKWNNDKNQRKNDECYTINWNTKKSANNKQQWQKNKKQKKKYHYWKKKQQNQKRKHFSSSSSSHGRYNRKR